MKKVLNATLILAMSLSLGSCVKDGYNEVTRTFSGSPINIITNLQNGATTVSKGSSYDFFLNLTQGVGTVSTNNLIINNNSWNFTTEETRFYTIDGRQGLFFNPVGNVNNNPGLPIKNSTFLGTLYFYYTTDFAGDYTFTPDYGYVVAASYNIGEDYQVKTFQEDTFFGGTTITTYPSGDGGTVSAELNYDPNSPNPMLYRIHWDTEKNTAALLIYNAKFSNVPAEPIKEVILAENLKVDYSKDGIVISGDNIIPEVGEAGAMTPNPRYVFNNIRFETTNDILTECKLTYTVAGIYTGDFTGAYVVEKMPEESTEQE